MKPILLLLVLAASPAWAARAPDPALVAAMTPALACLQAAAAKVDDGVSPPANVAARLDGACPVEMNAVLDASSIGADSADRAAFRENIQLKAVISERIYRERFPIKTKG